MNLVEIKNYIIGNSDLIQGISSIISALLTVIMLFIAIRALRTYKSQILFQMEVESKAYALRSFEIYLKFNQFEFHEHLLRGEFLKKYNGRIDFYGSEYVNANNETLIRRYCVYFGETDHVIPWQTDHLICWRTNVANAIEALSKVVI